MKVVLAGAGGFVGTQVTADLLAAGHSVTAFAQSAGSATALKKQFPGVEVIRANVSTQSEVAGKVPAGTEAIIYLPGLLRQFPGKGITFQGVHFDGVRNLIAEAKRVGAKRWIEMSALGAGPDSTTGYFATKWHAEELVRKSGLDWTIVRPSVVFDTKPNSKMNFISELANVVKMAPFLPIFGDGKYRMQPIALSEVSEIIVRSLAMPETIGKSFDLAGPDMIEYRKIMQMIAAAMGKKRATVYVPFIFVEPIASLLDGFAFFPVTRDQLTMLKLENISRDPAKMVELKRVFGLPKITLAEGLKGNLGG